MLKQNIHMLKQNIHMLKQNITSKSFISTYYIQYTTILHDLLSDSDRIFGASSSQSFMDWCLNAILRKCLPPFTFHVPVQTRSDVVSTNSR